MPGRSREQHFSRVELSEIVAYALVTGVDLLASQMRFLVSEELISPANNHELSLEDCATDMCHHRHKLFTGLAALRACVSLNQPMT